MIPCRLSAGAHSVPHCRTSFLCLLLSAAWYTPWAAIPGHLQGQMMSACGRGTEEHRCTAAPST